MRRAAPKVPGATRSFLGWDWTELLALWPESRSVRWPEWDSHHPTVGDRIQKAADEIEERGSTPSLISELRSCATAVSIETPDDAEEAAKAAFIRQRIRDIVGRYFDNGQKLAAKDRRAVASLRRFVATVGAKSPHTSGPMYVALARIEDDWTFLTWTDDLLEGMWT